MESEPANNPAACNSGKDDTSSAKEEKEEGKKKRKSRVRGIWSQEEDQILSRLVTKFGPRNWTLIAQGVPGRCSKSCRLRWCNQLDPILNRNPFSDEEDLMIIKAHTIHGNKWSAIAKLFPGRTDNAIKNHWNSTLQRRRYPNKYLSESGNIVEDVIFNKRKASSEETDKRKAFSEELDKRKASSEETLSNGDAISSRSTEGKEVSSLEYMDDQHEDRLSKDVMYSKEARESHTLFRPVAHVSGFSVYNHSSGQDPSSSFQRPIPVHGPMLQVANLDCEMVEGIYDDQSVPDHCGHGCCGMQNGKNTENSLLGPEFIEFFEPPCFPGIEIAAIARDISNLAWLKSGLENGCAMKT